MNIKLEFYQTGGICSCKIIRTDSPADNLNANNFNIVAQAAMGIVKIEKLMSATPTPVELVIQKVINPKIGNPIPGKISKTEKKLIKDIGRALDLHPTFIN